MGRAETDRPNPLRDCTALPRRYGINVAIGPVPGMNLSFHRGIHRYSLCSRDGVVVADLLFRFHHCRKAADPKCNGIAQPGSSAKAQDVLAERTIRRDFET